MGSILKDLGLRQFSGGSMLKTEYMAIARITILLALFSVCCPCLRAADLKFRVQPFEQEQSRSRKKLGTSEVTRENTSTYVSSQGVRMADELVNAFKEAAKKAKLTYLESDEKADVILSGKLSFSTTRVNTSFTRTTSGGYQETGHVLGETASEIYFSTIRLEFTLHDGSGASLLEETIVEESKDYDCCSFDSKVRGLGKKMWNKIKTILEKHPPHP